MCKVILRTFFLTSAALVFLAGCGSDKNSTEACLYETTHNLDKGNYDAVLASSCADSMQLGAAYFGKAGYDINSVINRFSETGDESNTINDLNVYMSSLTGTVTEETLGYLDKAKEEYTKYITDQDPNSDVYKDAQFYISLVNVTNGLSLIKTVLDTGLGTLSTECDKNDNGVPDEADATACALYMSDGKVCTDPTLNLPGVIATTDVPNIGIADKVGIYRGLTITVSGGGTAISCPNTNNEYNKLLFSQNSSFAPAVTTSNICNESSPDSSRRWPCPIEQNGMTLDLVSAVDENLSNASAALIQALSGATSIDPTEVEQAIQDVRDEACGGDTCTSSEIASYLQTL